VKSKKEMTLSIFAAALSVMFFWATSFMSIGFFKTDGEMARVERPSDHRASTEGSTNSIDEKYPPRVPIFQLPSDVPNRILNFVLLYAAVVIGAILITYLRLWGINRRLHEVGSETKKVNPFDVYLAFGTSILIALGILGFVGSQSISLDILANGFQLGIASNAFTKAIVGEV